MSDLPFKPENTLETWLQLAAYNSFAIGGLYHSLYTEQVFVLLTTAVAASEAVMGSALPADLFQCQWTIDIDGEPHVVMFSSAAWLAAVAPRGARPVPRLPGVSVRTQPRLRVLPAVRPSRGRAGRGVLGGSGVRLRCAVCVLAGVDPRRPGASWLANGIRARHEFDPAGKSATPAKLVGSSIRVSRCRPN